MRQLTRLSWAAIALAGVHALVGAALVFVPNPEGWLGGILYAGLLAVPLCLIGLGLRSATAWPRQAAGWAALAMAAFYVSIAIGNLAGYTPAEAIFVLAAMVPTVALDLAIFLSVALRAGRRAHGGTG